jgi:hypothetical protein
LQLKLTPSSGSSCSRVVSERGEAVERMRKLAGVAAQSVLECVGPEQAMETAIVIAVGDGRSTHPLLRTGQLVNETPTFSANGMSQRFVTTLMQLKVSIQHEQGEARRVNRP